MDTANEIKKKASQILLNGRKIGRFCDFCNKNVENCLDLAIRRDVWITFLQDKKKDVYYKIYGFTKS